MFSRLCVAFLAALFISATDSPGSDPSHWTQAVLFAPEHTDALYFHVLDRRDELKLRAFQLSDSATSMAPGSNEKAGTQPVAVTLILRTSNGPVSSNGKWTRAAGTSSITFARDVDAAPVPEQSLLLLARHRTDGPPPEFECHILYPDSAHYATALAHFGLAREQAHVGVSGLDTVCQTTRTREPSAALQKFLPEFDRIEKLSYVPTQRRGSTGIGYTLESLLGIEENNRQTGDFLGMELKSHRDSELKSSSSRRMNLFLKEPQWIDGLSHRTRIPKYGYIDGNGRRALYSTVTSNENSHGLSVRVDRGQRRVWLQFRGQPVAYWTFEILAGRLQEKLRETAFVQAATRGAGGSEQFHFNSVLYCSDPSIEPFLSLLERREVVAEMRMHLKPEGTARNHGTAFRVMQDQIPQLYAITVQCRSVK